MELTKELEADEGSFLLELRTSLNWNHTSFVNLVSKLYTYCQNNKEVNKLERPVASSIWYISTFIRDWTEHNNFPKDQPEEYYTKSYELVNDLAEFYFNGTSPYTNEEHLLDKIEELKSIANKR